MKVKLSILITFVVFIISVQAFCQSSIFAPYNFSVGGATSFPSGTTVSYGANNDDNAIVISPPGFSFQCAGKVYSNFLVSTNGWVALLPSATIPSYFTGSLPSNSISTYAGGTPLIAPMWDDIISNQFFYSVNGSDLFIRWNSKMPKNSSAFGYSYGVKLSSTGAITFIYPFNTYNINGSGVNSASIGFANGCGEFYSVTPTSSTTATVSDVAENSNLLNQIVTSISGTNTNATINVGSAAGITNGQFIGGTGIGPGAFVTNISGTTITASTNNIATLNGNGYFYTRPNNVQYVFNPQTNANDMCSNANFLGTISSTCNFITASNTHSTKTSSSGPTCSVNDTGDVWFSIIKPAGVFGVTIMTAPATCSMALTGTTVEVYSACGSSVLGCSTTGSTFPTFGEISLNRSCLVETLLVRVTGDNNNYGKFQICATTYNPLLNTLGQTCATAEAICSLPISFSGTTAGSINNYDSINSVCHTSGLAGEDYVYLFTPTVNQCISISVASATDNPKIFIYNGCPDSSIGSPTYCLSSAETTTGTATIQSVSVTAGATYYIVVDSRIGNMPYTLNLSVIGTGPSNDLCSNADDLGTLTSGIPCSYKLLSTSCSTPSQTATVPIPTCIPNQVPKRFIDGVTGDIWVKFTAGFNGNAQINTVQTATNSTMDVAMALYTGNCNSLSLISCDYNSGLNNMPSLTLNVTNGTTYYIRLWTENPSSTGQFNICISTICTVFNDQPCSAVFAPLGSTLTGNNLCSGNLGEPVNVAQCSGSGGTINTIWYKSVVPASGSIRIRTTTHTLTDTEIGTYTFPNGCVNAASSFEYKGCNDNGPLCGGSAFNNFSEVIQTGLTVGDTLYIAVDGKNSLVGTFDITIDDGSLPSLPPNEQDCLGAKIICTQSTIDVPSPGYRSYGNICDLPGATACWGAGERNSEWYTFNTSGTGAVKFDIFNASTVDLDFILWDVTGISNPCTQIQNGTLVNSACSYAANLTQIGIMDPPLLPGYDTTVTVSGNRKFILLINCFNATTNSAHQIIWNATPITSNSLTWNGGTTPADTSFNCNTCWGTCGSGATCSEDVVINQVPNLRQPTVSSDQSVHDLVINQGAQLRIKSGATLNICGSFTNLGTLICEPGSFIKFQSGDVQNISGNLTGTNAFANLIIEKSGGSVLLNNNIDIKGNFSIQNSQSVFNVNGKYMKLSGDFTSISASTTFLSTIFSVLELNGTSNQFFNNSNGAPEITLYRFVVNKPGGKVYLNSAGSSLKINSSLSLIRGIIVTRYFPTTEVIVRNGNSNAIINHNSLSYIDGKLRRVVYTGSPLSLPLSIDFPVGDSLSQGGYELANINFSTATTITELLATFNPWPGTPPNGPSSNECGNVTYNANQLFNHGYWTFSKTAATPFDGIYSVKMFNTGYSNNSGSFWTVVKADKTSNPSLNSSWSLIGKCDNTSTAAITRRTGLNGVNAFTSTITSASNSVTTVSTNELYPGLSLSGSGIPVGTVVASITDATTFVMSNNATASGSVLISTTNQSTSFDHHYAIAAGNSILHVQASVVLVTPILCFGGLATVQVSATNGTTPYLGTGTFQVAAGTYTYFVSDNNGVTSSATITVTQPSQFIGSILSTPVLCNGNLSQVNVSALGGTAPYSGTGIFSVSAGSHSYIISDSNGCKDTVEVTVTEPSQLIIDLATTPVNCFSDPLTVNVAASGGTSPYQGTGIFSGVSGTNNFTVTDANGCIADSTIQLTQPDQLNVSVSEISSILCNGGTATVSVTATGGTGPYQNTGIFSRSAGTYFFTVNDMSGCATTDSIIITEPDSLVVSSISSPVLCYGGSSSVTISATGGTMPYVGTGSFSMNAGIMQYNVTDANNCLASTTLSILEPQKVEGVTSSISTDCNGNLGSASVVASGGTGVYSYLWSDGQTSSSATALTAGSYSVVITDGNGCTGSVSAIVQSGGTIPVTPGAISGPTTICRNLSGIVFSIPTVNGATSYIWTLPNGISGSSTTNSITISTSSLYNGGFICVAAVNGCGTGPSSCINLPVITTYPTRPSVLSGPSILCGPAIYTFSTSSSNANSFTWTVTGANAVIISGQGTNTIQLSVPAGFSQGSVQVYASNCSGNSQTRGMTITGIPVHGNSVSGPSYVCANNTAVYSMALVPGVSASDYVWSVTGDASISNTTVGTTSNATINFGPAWTTGVVTINVFNSCGSFARSFTVRSTPTQPGSISGPNSGLCNLSGVSYSIAQVPTATSYTWTVPSDVAIVSTSPNGQSIVVNFLPTFISNSANICVKANSICGTGPARCYTVTSRTLAPTITGPVSVCKTQNDVVYSISPIVGANSYTWTISNNASITPSGPSSTVNFNSVTSSSAIIRSSAINSCGVSPIGLLPVNINFSCREISSQLPINDMFLFSPNPVTGEGVLKIYSQKEQKCGIRISDILGNILFSEAVELMKDENSLTLDFSNFERGVYILEVDLHGEFKNVLKVIVD